MQYINEERSTPDEHELMSVGSDTLQRVRRGPASPFLTHLCVETCKFCGSASAYNAQHAQVDTSKGRFVSSGEQGTKWRWESEVEGLGGNKDAAATGWEGAEVPLEDQQWPSSHMSYAPRHLQ
ncbi:hypothetical protein TRVL_07027 [Trypanosoma vivax]|nr:hypothetical protein TRVL_07027 [Trypanosoma vivax]